MATDGLSHTFYIRKGVKFHNGDDLAGADVKFSLERIMAPESTSIFASQWRAIIAGVDLKDDFTVVVRLKSPRFELLEGISEMGGGAAIVPKKYIQEKGVDYFRKNPIGSGPWRFVSYIPGDRLELEAVESHWRQVPQFKNITHLIVSDEATKVAMLKTGELDLAEVTADSAPTIKAAGLRLYVHDGGGRAMAYLFWDLDHPEKYPLGDVRVRKALSLAIGRKLDFIQIT
ncbi:MAG: ABC transporter substrate-binding protein, partial [Dehalococcoidia bacterium]|nr:ABC transporter substrate-binding protein [Dehalococcoidia bacterium]